MKTKNFHPKIKDGTDLRLLPQLEVFAFDKPVVVIDVPQLAKILFVCVLAIPLPHIVPGLKGLI